MASLMCLVLCQQWLEGWAQLELSAGEPVHGMSNMAITGQAPGLLPWPLRAPGATVTTNKETLPLTQPQKSHHITSFVLLSVKTVTSLPRFKGRKCSPHFLGCYFPPLIIPNPMKSLHSKCCSRTLGSTSQVFHWKSQSGVHTSLFSCLQQALTWGCTILDVLLLFTPSRT